jgi:hypothetical protein
MKQKPWSHCINMKIVWIFSHIFMWFDRLFYCFLFLFFSHCKLLYFLFSQPFLFLFFSHCKLLYFLFLQPFLFQKILTINLWNNLNQNFMSWCLKIQKYVHLYIIRKKDVDLSLISSPAYLLLITLLFGYGKAHTYPLRYVTFSYPLVWLVP